MAVFDPEMWIRTLLIAATGVVSMAVLACAIALARDTTGHDWHWHVTGHACSP